MRTASAITRVAVALLQNVHSKTYTKYTVKAKLRFRLLEITC